MDGHQALAQVHKFGVGTDKNTGAVFEYSIEHNLGCATGMHAVSLKEFGHCFPIITYASEFADQALKCICRFLGFIDSRIAEYIGAYMAWMHRVYLH